MSNISELECIKNFAQNYKDLLKEHGGYSLPINECPTCMLLSRIFTILVHTYPEDSNEFKRIYEILKAP